MNYYIYLKYHLLYNSEEVLKIGFYLIFYNFLYIF